MVLLAVLVSGAAAVTQERFEPGEALQLIERERVTQVSCWPNAARQIADHPTFSRHEISVGCAAARSWRHCLRSTGRRRVTGRRTCSA